VEKLRKLVYQLRLKEERATLKANKNSSLFDISHNTLLY